MVHSSRCGSPSPSMKSTGRLMYRENALDTIFVMVAVQKVVSVFVVDSFMVGEAVFHVI